MIKPAKFNPCTPASLQLFRAAVSQLSPLPDQAWEDATPYFHEYQLEAGEFFLHTGDLAEYTGFILSGSLREFFITIKGQEFNKNFIFDGEFTGSLFDLLTGEPSTASIEALTSSHLLVCRFTDFQSLYDKHKEWERIGRLIAEGIFTVKARREWEFMTLSAEERYQALLKRRPGLEERVSQYHIASHLGVSPVSLSRIRRQMGRPKLR